ncbi:AfsR/SARP family transcriptional regulator [Streptomyces bluensis]|uniref:AfsR/SARP family transcriptional regulator n=1 Tax=Streptomyces bluensis TaxID=33897 RepID=UPI003698A7C7
MRFRVLGPVSLSPRTPSAAKPRALLATLLVHAGEVVPVHSLIDELWGTEPPRTATTTLQVYVSQLRKVLADGRDEGDGGDAFDKHDARRHDARRGDIRTSDARRGDIRTSDARRDDTRTSDARRGDARRGGRRDVGSAGELLTRAPGYLLQVPEGEFDLPRFERLRTEGRTAYQEGEFGRASRLLHDALALWTGPALSGIPHGVRLESAAIRLDELRMEVLEQRIVADLRLGRHQELAGELLALANEHPLRETLHAHLMVALYRTGRGSDALRVYGKLRRSLVEELGVEPSAGLSRLHERVLRRDQSLDWHPPRDAAGRSTAPGTPGTGSGTAPGTRTDAGTGPAAGPRAGASGAGRDGGTARGPEASRHVPVRTGQTAQTTPTGVPRQTGQARQTGDAGREGGRPLPAPGTPPVLPAAPPGFVGRDEELARGERALRGSAGRPAVRVLAVSGPAGVGKTSLALQLAHRIADLFPDGQLLMRLRGPQGRPLSAAQAGATLLRRLGDDTPGSPSTDPDEVTDRLRRALHGRRLLLVLDGATSVEQIRPLLQAAADCAVILTSRRSAAALDGAEHLLLDAVRPDEAVELLLAAGGERMAQDPVAVAEIARLCGCFPLALRVAAAALTARPHTTPAALAGRLRDERTRLGVLREGDLDLRSSLLTGYQEVGPALQRAFRLLSLAPAADFAVWTAAALLDTDRSVAEETAEELVRAQLLEARTDGHTVRYAFHSLLRVLATDLVDGEADSARTRRDAVERLGRTYAALTRHADRRLTPGRDWRTGPDPVPAPTGTEPDAERIVGANPLRWFREEATGLVEMVRQTHAAGLWPLVWQLAGAAEGYFHACAAWEDWEETHRLALDAAVRAGDTEAEAAIRYSLGDLAWQRREADRAVRHYTDAQHAFKLAGDRIGAARCRIGVADILLGQGRLGAAARRYGRALALCSAGGDSRGVVAALNGLALVNLRQGREEAAMRQLAQGRRAAERLGDRRWAEYIRRTAARLTTDTPRRPAHSAHAVEVRPGMWLIGTAAPAAAPALARAGAA